MQWWWTRARRRRRRWGAPPSPDRCLDLGGSMLVQCTYARWSISFWALLLTRITSTLTWLLTCQYSFVITDNPQVNCRDSRQIGKTSKSRRNYAKPTSRIASDATGTCGAMNDVHTEWCSVVTGCVSGEYRMTSVRDVVCSCAYSVAYMAEGKRRMSPIVNHES